jgi:hypothetical protein
MAKNKKYSANIETNGNTWTAQITRQITSRKTHVSKEQDGFASEQEAQEWAELQLAEFTKTQDTNNQRHSAQRKTNEEGRLQRSSRRAEKTLEAKNKKAEEERELAAQLEQDTET